MQKPTILKYKNKAKSQNRRSDNLSENDNEQHSRSPKGIINYNSKYLKNAVQEEKKKRILKTIKEKEIKDK